MSRGLKAIMRHHLWHVAPALVSLAVYLMTLAPGVYAYDSAELATGAYTLGIVHPTGYPTYLLLGRLFSFLPIGSIAYRLNLLSAVLGALTVWLVTQIIYLMTKDKVAAVLGAFSLSWLYPFWSMSSVAEVYTLHTVLFALALLALLYWLKLGDRRLLLVTAFLLGLSLTNHVSSALLVPGFLLIILLRGNRRELVRTAPAAVAAFLLGLAPYLYLPLRDLAAPELNYVRSYYGVDLQTLQGMLWMVTGQAYRFFAFSYDLPAYLREVAGFGAALWRGFTALGMILAGVGALATYRKDRVLAIGTLWWFASTALFFSGYAVADKYTMFLAAELVVSLWIGVGLSWLRTAVPRPWETATPRPAESWRHVTSVAAAGMILAVFAFTFGRVDKSGALEGDLFAQQVLGSLEPGAVVLAQWSSAVTLEYYRDVEGLRPDVEIFNRSRHAVAEYYKLWLQGYSHEQILREITDLERRFVDRIEDSRPVYGTEYDPELANSYEYLPIGNVYRLLPRSMAGQVR